MTFRVEERDATLAGKANNNDGNLNYGRGLVSNASKFTTDLDIGDDTFGVFFRATGFIDFETENGMRERTPLHADARERVGKDLDLLDAYAAATFDVDDTIVDMRLGRHVLNWGESTFIPNGINAINHFDVSKLRLPGSELREALLPVGMVSVATAPASGAVSMEAFYQLDWEKTEIDPVGSYFSVTDYVGPGAERAVVPLLPVGDRGLTVENNPFNFLAATSVADAFSTITGDHPDFLMARREADRVPGDSGQWGIAVRYLAEELNDTEFGFYYMNYHSRLPVVGAHTGSAADAVRGLQIAGGMFAAAPAAVRDLVTAAVTDALAAARCPSPTASAQCGAIASAVGAQATAQYTAAVQGAIEGAAPVAGIDAYIGDAGHYFVEYPEDIQLFGVSFNTEIGATGWALQGEYSYRRDAPLQIAEREIFSRALGPFTNCLGQSIADPANGPLCIGRSALEGLYDADVSGYVERDVSQVQATATRVFGPTMGADGLVLVTEVALMHVHDMPGVEDTPLESPAGGVLSVRDEEAADADATSWGYRLAARLDYNSAIGSINLYPFVQLLHDVDGNSPTPSGPFVEGRTALTLGVSADYLNRWQASLGYTRHAGKASDLSDRDFISASVKYSF